MIVVLSVVRRDQWTAQKIPFWSYYICCVVCSGSAQNLSPCPSLSQAYGA